MARSHLVPMLVALGLGACALENPAVRVGPMGADVVVATDVVGTDDRPEPVDRGLGDTGAVDTSVVDTGPVDTGVVDTGPVDTGVIDTGPADTGEIDSGVVDSGVVDTGPMDTGVIDTGPLDSGVADTGPVDSGVVDTGPVDTGPADVGVPVSSTCGSQNQVCCSAPYATCRANLSCQFRAFQPNGCLPCGGWLQVCCGGSCNAGPCRGGICTGL